MLNPLLNKLEPLVRQLYPNEVAEVCEEIITLIIHYQDRHLPTQSWVNQRDVVLITYGDSILKQGEKPLRTLYHFMSRHLWDSVNAVHILPCFPYTSDDGFSVEDYKQVNPELGDWDDIAVLASEYDVMLDAVINHISRWSYWFRRYLVGDPEYDNFFISADPELDYSKVTRPRALPLLTEFDSHEGKKWIWTTFSDDQIDLNYSNPKVMLAVLDVLCSYCEQGARMIRADAIGFIWKKLGTSCMHLPETHAAIQLMRLVLDEVAPGTILVSETNVPHKDNISYFGNGYNEAQMVYQFPLPPLVVYSFLTCNAEKLSRWAGNLDMLSPMTSYFNFLASHDGIGMRPIEGILTEDDKNLLMEQTYRQGGQVSFKNNGDGTKSPYELNICMLDMLSLQGEEPEVGIKRMIAAHGILLSMMGIPAIYIHSLLGSRNDIEGMTGSGIPRRINRAKLRLSDIEQQLMQHDSERSKVFSGIRQLVMARKRLSAFAPQAEQKIQMYDPRVFSIQRYNALTGGHVLSLVNLSDDEIDLEPNFQGVDVLTDTTINHFVKLKPFQVCWIKSPNEIRNKKGW